jgi:hypothetical protein
LIPKLNLSVTLTGNYCLKMHQNKLQSSATFFNSLDRILQNKQ